MRASTLPVLRFLRSLASVANRKPTRMQEEIAIPSCRIKKTLNQRTEKKEGKKNRVHYIGRERVYSVRYERWFRVHYMYNYIWRKRYSKIINRSINQ